MKTFVGILLVSACAFLSASFAPKTAPLFTIKTVVIDAGHGGKDPGCHGGSVKEKDVALAIALKLGAYIESHFKDVKVVYTRKTDVFVELNERAAIANRNNADLFICIHCNSACFRDKATKKDICKDEVHGAETYVMGLHKTEGNLNVAARENDAVQFEGDNQKNYESLLNSDEARMVLSLYQNVYMTQSINFAQNVQDQFRERCARTDNGVNQAGFLVLWKTAMPSVLIETGFLTNPDEEKFLGSDKGQDYMAAGIFRAFRKWKDDLEGNSGQKYTDEVELQKPYVSSGTSNDPPKNDPPKNDPPKKDTTRVVKDVPVTNNPPQVIVTGSKPVFRVQLLSSDKPLDAKAAQFKGLQDVIFYQENDLYKYTVGEYATSAEARKRQDELRANGFKEAFVIAFLDGKRIPVSQAEKLIIKQ